MIAPFHLDLPFLEKQTENDLCGIGLLYNHEPNSARPSYLQRTRHFPLGSGPQEEQSLLQAEEKNCCWMKTELTVLHKGIHNKGWPHRQNSYYSPLSTDYNCPPLTRLGSSWADSTT